MEAGARPFVVETGYESKLPTDAFSRRLGAQQYRKMRLHCRGNPARRFPSPQQYRNICFQPRGNPAHSASHCRAIPVRCAEFPSFPSFPVQLPTCKLLRGHSASVARVWRYRNLIITVITIISCAPITSTDEQTNARQLRRQLQLRFDSHSTAIRPRYDNSTIRRPMLQSQPTYLWAAACGECK